MPTILETMARKKSSNRQKNRSRRPLWVFGGAAFAVTVIFLGIVYFGPWKKIPGENFRSQGNVHIELGQEHPFYNSSPPTSGWHTPEVNSWGSFDYIIPDERLVHNMEDGGVILWYSFGTPEENMVNIASLETVTKGYRRVIIVPREGMPTRYALTAWQHLERFDTIDQQKMRRFVEAFEGIDHHVRRP
jgi:hypothetical protein